MQTLTGTPPVYPLAGARSLSEAEILLANAVKAHAEHVKALIASIAEFQTRELHAIGDQRRRDVCSPEEIKLQQHLIEEGQRWRMRATDTLQDGFMQLVRSVTRPTSF